MKVRIIIEEDCDYPTLSIEAETEDESISLSLLEMNDDYVTEIITEIK